MELDFIVKINFSKMSPSWNDQMELYNNSIRSNILVRDRMYVIGNFDTT